MHISFSNSFIGILLRSPPRLSSWIQTKRAYGTFLNKICGTCTAVLSRQSQSLRPHRREKKCIGRYAKSSMGWDPPSKKEELFHHDSRFVITRQRAQAQDGPDPDSPSAGEVPSPVMAYSMFRFDVENDECVLYWYSWLDFFFRFPPSSSFFIVQLRAAGLAIGAAGWHGKGPDEMSM